jgi:hypothetical protein
MFQVEIRNVIMGTKKSAQLRRRLGAFAFSRMRREGSRRWKTDTFG